MIRHIHGLFILAPGLRRWSYYCFYCLQAALVILLKVADDQYRSRRQHRDGGPSLPGVDPSLQVDSGTVQEDRRLCNLAIDIFERIELKASQRCADVVRHFLDSWGVGQTVNGPGIRHAGNSPDGGGGDQVPPEALIESPLENSAAISQPVDQPTVPNRACTSVDTAREGSSGAGCAGSLGDSSSISPQASLTGLQAEFYDALYGDGLSGGFRFDQQSYLFDAEAVGSYAPRTGTDDVTDGSLPACNGMPFCDGYDPPGWSL